MRPRVAVEHQGVERGRARVDVYGLDAGEHENRPQEIEKLASNEKNAQGDARRRSLGGQCGGKVAHEHSACLRSPTHQVQRSAAQEASACSDQRGMTSRSTVVARFISRTGIKVSMCSLVPGSNITRAFGVSTLETWYCAFKKHGSEA